MLYKAYGKTGKNVSVIACGGMRFANPADIDASAELIRYAHSQVDGRLESEDPE
jgi:predicted aldo/keto reductase-like oxidoreductase